MFSQRFKLPVVITLHARERMAARNMDDALLLDLIETGVDNVFVVKTVMHHWEIAA